MGKKEKGWKMKRKQRGWKMDKVEAKENESKDGSSKEVFFLCSCRSSSRGGHPFVTGHYLVLG